MLQDVYVLVRIMGDEDKRNAVIIINCRKGQVLEIIEHIKAKFPDVEVTYEVLREEMF